MKKRIIQTAFFVVFTFFLSQTYLVSLPRYTVGLSPSMHLGNIVTLLTGKASMALIFPALVLMIVAFVLKKRFFCFFVCPVGFLQDVLPSVKRAIKVPGPTTYLNYIVFLILFFFSLGTINMLGVFDPLVIFARFIAVFQRSFIVRDLSYLMPFAIILLVSFVSKRFWCWYVCPLGAFFDMCHEVKAYYKKSADKGVDKTRRHLVHASLAGLVLAFTGKKLGATYAHERLIRPPGALPEERFKDACVRCGNCMKACITDGLQPVLFESGWDGVATPHLVPRIGECDEYCTRCGDVCPTGAIHSLELYRKRNVRIGVARVEKKDCLGWDGDQLCFICAEFCPYLAIDKFMKDDTIPCPVIKEDVCRGCGLCEKQCPTHAIKVYRR
jgi:ferredoxin